MAAVALLLLSCSAAASLILALPIMVAAESLSEYSFKVVRRFWITVNALPFVAGLLLTAAAFAFLRGDITATPHQQLRTRAHLCLARFTLLPDAPFRFQLYAVIASGLLLYALVRFVLSVRASLKAEAIAGQLAEQPEEAGEPAVVVLDSEEPECFSLGLGRPVIMLTTGLPQLLTAAETEAVLAHERCHIRHRDNALELVMRLLTDPLIWLPTTHYYLRSLRATLEQACDAEAAEMTSAENLASALEKMAAAKQAQQVKLQGDLAVLRPLFPSYASPTARIAALLGEKYASLALPLPVILGLEAVVLTGLAVWLSRPLHDTLYCAASSLLTILGH